MHLLMFLIISPGPPPSPPTTTITESFLNCQIELSGGHLFNKFCLVYYNEMERTRGSFCYQGGIFEN